MQCVVNIFANTIITKMYPIFVLIFIICIIIYSNCKNYEGFSEQSGKFCVTCENKTFNQCQGCFNCGVCLDINGNYSCMGGNYNGPYNNERCIRWYHGDPWGQMLKDNSSYKCSYGPKQSNRIIGVNP